MLIRKGDRVAHPGGLIEVFVLIRAQQDPIAIQGGKGGIGVAEHLRVVGLLEPLVAPDVQLRPLLFPLIAIEDAQRHGDAEA